MSTGIPLRIKYICGKHGRLLVGLLMLVSVLLYAGAAVAEPPEPPQETVQTNQQRVATNLTASGEVTNDSALYDAGETVSDSPVYLLSSTPRLTLDALTTVPSDQAVTVTHRVTLELFAERRGERFWSDRDVLTERTQQVTDGTARTTTTLDVATLATERLADITAETDGVGTVQARITVNASYDTGSYSGHTNLSSPLAVSDRSFEFDTPRQAERTHSTPVVRDVAVDRSGVTSKVAAPLGIPNRSVYLLVAGVFSLLLAVAVRVVDIRIGDFESFEREYESMRYTEWISRGRIPDTGQYARVPVEALVDLVDIAIDSEKRVIYDTQQQYYAVVDGNLVYEFRSDADAPSRMHEFGLAPLDGDTVPAEQALQEAEAAVGGENGEEATG